MLTKHWHEEKINIHIQIKETKWQRQQLQWHAVTVSVRRLWMQALEYLMLQALAKKLSSVCPSCSSPGYWIIERIAGLKCERCGQPTQVTRAQIYGCSKCGYKATIERTDLLYANPGHCDYCNP
jgi:Zn finger protein HypA/HybF involved in hydrogenase expression